MKIALVYSEKLPFWISSQTIRSNLLDAYLLAFPNASVIPTDYEGAGKSQFVQKITQGKFDKIIFLESSPTPLQLLKELFNKKTPSAKTEFYFHIYGDFTLFTPEWFLIFKTLKKAYVKILLASPAQMGLVSEFFHNKKKSNLLLCPFPINSNNFYPSQIREKLREQFGIKNDEIVLLYSGRISPQKGFPLILKWLDRFIKETGIRNIRLLIAGNFDDLGTPFWGKAHPMGLSYFSFQRTLQSLSELSVHQVQYLGLQKTAELRKICELSDIFVSLSTYHDEDYGMAPLEAIFCGCSALLSSWGGFNSFGDLPSDVKFCTVKIGPKGLVMSYSSFKKGLTTLITQAIKKPQLRGERIIRYQDSFSVKALSHLLLKIHKTPAKNLAKLSVLFEIHSKKILLMRQGYSPYQSPSSEDPLYHRLYRHYTQVQR